jgi:O-antigen/teichoic acid export membrane protein
VGESEQRQVFDEIRDTLKHSFAYGGGTAFRSVMALLLIRLYGLLLTHDFGIFALLEATERFLIVILEMGMGPAYLLAVMHEETTDKKTALSTAFAFVTVSSLVVTVILMALSKPLSALLVGATGYHTLLVLMLCTAFFQVLRAVPLARLRAEGRSTSYSMLVGSAAGVQVVFCFVALAVLRAGLAGAVAANTAAAALTLVFFLAAMRGDLVRRFSRACLASMLKFGIPLVPAALAVTALTVADRYFLQHFRSLDEVGLYDMGYRFGMVMGLAITAVQVAWPPAMYAVAKRENAQGFYALFLTYLFWGLCFLALALVFFSPDILRAMRWEKAAPVVPWIVASYVLWGLQAVTNVGVNLKKKTHYQAAVVVAGAVLNLLLNRVLVPAHGAAGAAAATLISYGLIAVGAAAVSLRLYPIRYEYGRLFKIAVVAVLLGLIVLPMSRLENLWLSVGIKAVCLLSYPLVLYVAGLYRPGELQYMRQSLSAFLSSRRSR